ncbi:MAG: hypothetical protein WCZ90_14400, partial [Melioribacteraceae bacterium]
MKYSKLFFLLFFLITKLSSAMIWEFGIRVQNSSNELISRGVFVYGYNPSTKDYVQLYSGYCPDRAIDQQWNVIFNVSGISGDYSGALATLPQYDVYVFKIGDQYSRNVVGWGGGYVDVTMTYTEGSGFGSPSAGTATTGTWTMQTITLKNIMGNDYVSVSGLIKLNDENIIVGYAGVDKYREASTFPHAIYAENQRVGEVDRKWREWEEDGNQNMTKTLTYPENYSYTARYARQYSATISTNIGGGEVYINSSSYSCPTTSSYIYDDLNNSITAYNQIYDYYSYTFDHWNYNGSFYSSQNTIYVNEPSSSVSYQAIFTNKKLSNVGEGLTFGTSQNDPIVLNWTDNPHATQYAIWR